jgi:hypothetical protein
VLTYLNSGEESSEESEMSTGIKECPPGKILEKR